MDNRDGDDDDDVNKLVKIGGSAMLGSSLFAAATVAVVRSAMAKKQLKGE